MEAFISIALALSGFFIGMIYWYHERILRKTIESYRKLDREDIEFWQKLCTQAYDMKVPTEEEIKRFLTIYQHLPDKIFYLQKGIDFVIDNLKKQIK